jgi:hypothetical protein
MWNWGALKKITLFDTSCIKLYVREKVFSVDSALLSKIVPQRLYILDPLSHDPQRYIYIYIGMIMLH